MQLSPHFTLEEFTFSQTAERMPGIANVPAPEIIQELKKTARLMEQVRHLLGDRPIFVSSGYRSIALNEAIGGSSRSQHCRGQACDFISPPIPPKEIALKIYESDIMFDQLIYEGRWVHISQSEYPRREALTAVFETVSGRRTVKYIRGIS